MTIDRDRQRFDAECAASTKEGDSKRLRWALLCCSGTSFLIMLDSNIVAVSLPSIARDIHAAFSDIEWVVSAYLLSFAATLLPAGSLADRFGRRRILVVGLATFTLASLFCGVAQRSDLLNWSRAIQGVGAALQLSAALGLIGHTFKGPDRARAFAFWGVVVGAAVAIGPVLGGIITSTVGWRWAFFVNVPIGLGLIALGLASLDESMDPNARSLDLPGIVLFAVGMFCLVWASIEANAVGWSNSLTLVRFLVGAALLVMFVVVERRRRSPMMDLALFKRPTYLGGTFAMLGYAFAGQVMMTLLPLYLQSAHDLSPFMAGIAMMPFAVPLVLSPQLAAPLTAQLTGRTILTLGLIAIGCGNLLTAAILVWSGNYFAVALGMLISGAGTGLLNGETTKVLIGAVPQERAGMAGGLTGTTRFVGIILGISVLGAVLAAGTEYHAAAGLRSLGVHWNTADVHIFALRAAAGTEAGVDVSINNSLKALANASFTFGFALLLAVAGVVALASAGLTYAYVLANETPPTKPHRSVHGKASS